MVTEQELKELCTSEIIKKMVELAEGFEYYNESFVFINDCTIQIFDTIALPLLVHRAVSGWNKKNLYHSPSITIDELEVIFDYYNDYNKQKEYNINNYNPQSLIQSECAMLHCLIDILRR